MNSPTKQDVLDAKAQIKAVRPKTIKMPLKDRLNPTLMKERYAADQANRELRAKNQKVVNQYRHEKVENFQAKTNSLSNKLNKAGDSWIKRATVPIVLFFLGTLLFPLGIIFWLIGLYMMFSPKKA